MNEKASFDEHVDFENRLFDAIKTTKFEVEHLKDEAKDITRRRRSAFEALESVGVHPDAMKFCLKYIEADEATRRQIDLSLWAVRAALGKPMQLDLLNETEAKLGLKEIVDGA